MKSINVRHPEQSNNDVPFILIDELIHRNNTFTMKSLILAQDER